MIMNRGVCRRVELFCLIFCCCSAVTVGTPFIRGQIQLLFTRTLAYHIATSSLFDWPIDAQRVNPAISIAYHRSQVLPDFTFRLLPKNHDPNLVQYLNNTNPKPRRHASQTLTIPKHGTDSNEDREEEKESYRTFETGFSLHVFPSCLSSCPCLVSQLESVSQSAVQISPPSDQPNTCKMSRVYHKKFPPFYLSTGVSGGIRTRFLLNSKLFSE
jgi:hypothetical protein